MKNWITVTVPDNGQDVTTLVNISNITHIKDLKGGGSSSGSGKSRIYLNTSTDSSQRYLPCQEDFDTVIIKIADAQGMYEK